MNKANYLQPRGSLPCAMQIDLVETYLKKRKAFINDI